MGVHHLKQSEARRIAISAQMLDSRAPVDLMAVAHQLAFIQVDPTAAIAPNADLVLWTRIGSSYRPADLQTALEQDRSLFEVNALIRPMADLGLYLAEMKAWPWRETTRQWLEANNGFRNDILARLEASGPLASRDIPDTSAVAWPSTGWTNDRNVTQMLEILTKRGEIAIFGRRGRERIWDIAERVYPADTPVVPLEEALRIRDERRLRALGIARAKAQAVPGEPAHVGGAGEPATIDGIAGSWRVHPEALDQLFTGRTALLSPFDRLVHDRVRALDLFGFEYALEMYKPQAARRWGYFALPVLHDERLVGKVDAKVNRKDGTLEVYDIHEDTPFTPAMTDDLRGELERLAAWLGVAVSGKV